MARFVCNKSDELVVTIHQDGDDVDIFVNNVMIGWFEAESGKLKLLYVGSAFRDKLEGVCFNSNGTISTETQDLFPLEVS